MTALGDFSPGDILTAADLNAIGAWDTWTPTWTNFTVGNANTTYRYTQIGSTVFYSIIVVLGSTSSMGTEPEFTLPVTASAYRTAQGGEGSLETGAQSWVATTYRKSATNVYLRSLAQTGGNVYVKQITSTSPATWTTGDVIVVKGWYEAA